MSTANRRSTPALAPPPQALAPGTCVDGRYAIERLLGQGGMGEVYVARDAASGKRIALKRLEGAASHLSYTLFEREYRVLVSLRHPSIVEAFDYGRDAQGAY